MELLKKMLEDTDAIEKRTNCPFCNDTKQHLYVNTIKGVYYCHKCQSSGVITGVSKFKSAEKKEIQLPTNLPIGVYPLTKKIGFIGRKVRDYLLRRGLTETDIRKHNIYYGTEGKFSGRAVFPFFRKGKMVYYTSRACLGQEPKTRDATGKKDVFNIERASEYPEVVVVEGVLDAILTGDDAIALCGKNMSPYQIDLLLSYGITDVNIMLDADAIEFSWKIAHKIKKFFRIVRVIELPFGDPADLQLRRIGWRDKFKTTLYTSPNRWRRLELKRF